MENNKHSAIELIQKLIAYMGISVEDISGIGKPIFTTADNVQIYDVNTVIWTYNKISKSTQNHAFGNSIGAIKDKTDKNCLVFSTLEARDEYAQSLKPKLILVTEDGVEITEPNQRVYQVDINDWGTDHDPACEARNQVRDGWLAFSTEKARNEYLKMHKPLFSIDELQTLEKESGYNLDSNMLIERKLLNKLAEEKLK